MRLEYARPKMDPELLDILTGFFGSWHLSFGPTFDRRNKKNKSTFWYAPVCRRLRIRKWFLNIQRYRQIHRERAVSEDIEMAGMRRRREDDEIVRIR